MSARADPHASRPAQWVGATARFQHEGRALVGVVIAHEFAGWRATRTSELPDYLVAIRGASGAKLRLSLFDSRMTFD